MAKMSTRQGGGLTMLARRNPWGRLLLALLLGGVVQAAPGSVITESGDASISQDPYMVLNGLSADAIFTLNTETPYLLEIELFNTSTGVPEGFDSSDQLLTSISFDLGLPGLNPLDPKIMGGTVLVGPTGYTVDFDNVSDQLGPGGNISGEWGYGNAGGTGLLPNLVTANAAGATAFSTMNLDGPPYLDGPQAGIATDPPQIDPGGLGVVLDSILISLTLDTPLTDLDFLEENGVVTEFGSDAAFLVPEPLTFAFFGLGALAVVTSKRVRKRL
jgi:hypothetical protein